MSPALRTTASIALQLITTGFLIGILALASAKWSPTPFNALWMLGIPLLIGIIANRTLTMKIVMSVELIFCAFISLMFAAAILGLGP